MLRKPPQFRNLADRIFTELLQQKELIETFHVCAYLKQHVTLCVSELVEAEKELSN